MTITRPTDAEVSTGPLAVLTGSGRMLRALAHDRVHRPGRPGPGSRVPLTDFDPSAPPLLVDPYPAYRRLAGTGPVHYNPRTNIWTISGHPAVREALRADDTLSSAWGVARLPVQVPMMLMMDRPEHTRLRRLVAEDFSRAGLRRWQDMVARLCGELVTGMARRGEAEVVADLAEPLPVQLIIRMLGIPEADRPRFRRWSHHIIGNSDARLDPRALPAMVLGTRAMVQLRRYLEPLLPGRRAAPGEDLISRLLAVTGSERLTDDELYWFVLLLLIAGNETTTNLLGPLVRNLALRPELYRRLRAEPELIPAAVEEQLRFESPVQGLHRVASRDYEVGGHVIPEGARVLVLYASANRDPAHYPEPDVFDLDRRPTDHLAFGSGIHFCLGAYLSRLEARQALQELVRQVERIEPAGTCRWTRNPMVRGLTRLPVRLHPA